MSKRHKREVGSSVHNSWGEVQWSKLRPYGVYILLRTHKSRSFVSVLHYIELKKLKRQCFITITKHNCPQPRCDLKEKLK
jgi:hypothetical protein